MIKVSQNEIPRDSKGKPLEDAFLVEAEINGNGPPFIIRGATIEGIRTERSIVKDSEGGAYYVVSNSKITITHFK